MKKIFKLLMVMTVVSCSSSDDYVKNPEAIEGNHEEPVKMVLNFDNKDSGIQKSFEYHVPEGSTEAVTTDISLPEGTYNVTVNLFAADGDDLTEEIFGHDKEEHFVYYSKIDNSKAAITYAEDDIKDSKSNKIGMKTIWKLTPGENLQFVYLIHQPAEKNPNAASTEQLGGEIDMEGRFKLVVTK